MKSQKFRYLVLFLFLALMTWIGYRHQVLGGGAEGTPAVDALCPFGGLEGIYGYVRHNAWLRRLAPSSLVLFAAVAALTVLLGRVFCGWICPMGAITAFTSRFARKAGFKSRSLPSRPDFILRGLKYVLLVVILVFTWKLGTLVFRDYDPWKAWMHLSGGFAEWGTAMLVLLAVIIAEFFIERFWCRYLCPLGAAFGLLQKISFTKIKRDPAVCINCKKCDRVCPTGLSPSASTVLPAADCIACGKCVDSCPKPGAIGFSFFRSKAVSPVMLGLLGVLAFTVFWGGAKVSGLWQTSAPVTAAVLSPADRLYGWMTLEQAAEAVGLSPQQIISISGLPEDTPHDVAIKKLPGEPDEMVSEKLAEWFAKNQLEALPNIEEIRGSMTLREVSRLYGLRPEAVLEKAGWPAGLDADAPLKDLSKDNGREVSEIRDAVRALVK